MKIAANVEPVDAAGVTVDLGPVDGDLAGETNRARRAAPHPPPSRRGPRAGLQ
jgi:hypothetical protein